MKPLSTEFNRKIKAKCGQKGAARGEKFGKASRAFGKLVTH
jgi:hypothetical protein